MKTPTDLATQLSQASVKKFWNVYSAIDWPQSLDASRWSMAPELISIFDTTTWDTLSDDQRTRLSFYELINFFSLTLHGERPLVQGLCNQMYSRQNREVTEYIHHFLDEENKHMVMFGEFCNRYAGKVYPQGKIAFAKSYAKGEEDVTFFIKVLIVEELGDYYNVALARDERVEPLVREINSIHHIDEARHIVFGHRVLKELWQEFSPKWPDEVIDNLRAWLAEYLKSSWTDFYNLRVYRDAGIPDAYEVRQAALRSPVCLEHRRRVSKKLIDYFLETGILLSEPAL